MTGTDRRRFPILLARPSGLGAVRRTAALLALSGALALPAAAQTPSTDATLSELSLGPGVTLDPTFSPTQGLYHADVAHTTTEVTVTATTNHAEATFVYLNQSATELADADDTKDGHQVGPLHEGFNVFGVKVTAEDETTVAYYTLVVVRKAPSTDAKLSGLSLGTGVTLTPTFVPGTTSYTASVANDVAEVTVTATTNHANATFVYLNASDTALADADDMEDGHQVALVVGTTVIKVTVTPESSVAQTQTYTVTVTRRGPVPAAPANFTAVSGDGQAALSWSAPQSGSGVTGHEYRYKTDGSYPESWTPIDDSAPGGANVSGFTVTGLTNETAYTFQLRAVNAVGGGAAAEVTVTPMSEICEQGTGDVWCGVLTVGRVLSYPGRLLQHGFMAEWHGERVGALSDTRLRFGTNAYTIDEVTVGAEQYKGFLFFGLNRALTAADRARLVLYVGGAAFALSDANDRAPTYHWRKTGLDWSSASRVKLRLRADLRAAPAGLRAEAPVDTGGLLKVSWSAPGAGPVVTGYQVKFWKAADSESSYWLEETKGTETSIFIPTPGGAAAEYKLRVRARTALGWSPWSAPTTARTGAPQSGQPLLSLHVLDRGTEVSEGAITEGGLLFYRIKATNIRNYHDWGEPGLLGHFRLRYEWAGDRHPPHPVPALLNDSGSEPQRPPSCQTTPLMRVGLVASQPSFTQTAATTGYWDFWELIPDYAAELGPVTLKFDNQPCDRPVSGSFLQAGSPNQACVEIADNGSGPAYDGDEKPTYSCSGSPAGSASRAVAPLTAAFADLPSSHEGTAFTFRIEFSEDVAVSAAEMRDDALTVTGGTVTGAAQVDGRADRWSITVTPSGTEEVLISLPPGRDCSEAGAVCTADGRQLPTGLARIVAGPPVEPLTASFVDVPEAHDGERAFTLRIAFSEPLSRMNGRRLREDVVAVAGGGATKASRVNRRRDLWKLTVEPHSPADVTVTLAAGAACGTPAAICASDGRSLSETISATVAGPPASAPAKPTGLDATASHNSVTLTWDDPGDDSITGYVILRRVRVNNTGGDFSVLVADTGSAATTYTDDTVAASTTYTYRIKAINGAGTSERSRWYHIDTPAAPASKPAVADGPPGLAPNAPNPFNANTLIPYRLDADGPVRLEIYNLLGQPVRTLVNQYQDAGFYKVRWDARDRRGALVSAGMYLVRLHYPGGVQTQRLLYLK